MKNKAVFVLIFAVCLVFAVFMFFGTNWFFQAARSVSSAFDVDPTPLPGSNIRVCTEAAPSYLDSCSAPLQPTFNWSITSGTPASYAVQVDNNGWTARVPSLSFLTPEVDTGEISSYSNSYTVPSGNLAYGATYYWQVAVKDNLGSWSGWTEGVSFTTPTHHYPAVNFSWAPTSPSVGEKVQFADQSVCYSSGIVSTPCSSWTWTIPNATYVDGTSANSQNPVVQFTAEGSKGISLVTGDGDGHSCSTSKSITNVNKALPNWRETGPR